MLIPPDYWVFCVGGIADSSRKRKLSGKMQMLAVGRQDKGAVQW